MSLLNNKWAIIAMVFMVATVLASFTTVWYYYQYTDYYNRTSGMTMKVNVIVDYGNGTRAYYNDTQALTGDSFLAVTQRNVNVKYTGSGASAFVTSIEGNTGNATNNDYWSFWTWNTSSSTWSQIQVSVGAYYPINGETIISYVTHYSDDWSSCTSPAPP